jgi:hypothetical protein
MAQIPITITQDDLDMIKAGMAFPLIEEVALNDEQIINFCVRPAMDEYYRWYPVQVAFQENVESQFEIAFPDDMTYGVVDARLNNSGQDLQTGSYTGNRILDILVLNNASRNSIYGGSYGTRYNWDGMNRARMQERNVGGMQLSNRTNTRVRVDRTDRKVKGFCNMPCVLTIIWAKRQYDFSVIRFEHYRDVVELSQAFIYRQLADAVGILDMTELPVKINAQTLLEKANTKEKEIKDKWAAHTKVLVMPKQLGYSSGLL